MARVVVNLELGHRVLRARKKAGLTQKGLADASGIGQSGIVEIEKGGIRRPKRLREIARATNVWQAFFVEESDEMRPFSEDEPDYGADDDGSDDDRTVVSSVNSEDGYEGRLPGAMPDIEVESGAGPGGREDEDSQITFRNGETYRGSFVRGEIVLPSYLVAEYTQSPASHIHSLRVRGDSMEPTLNSGDRVFVDTRDVSLSQGGLFVLIDRRWDEVIVKRIRRAVIDGAPLIEIVSDNERQGNETVSLEEVEIVGRVVARLTRV